MLNEKITPQLEELLAAKNYRAIKALLNGLTPQDIALLLDGAEESDVSLLFRLLPKELAAETFVEMDSDLQRRLLRSFSDAELRSVVAELFVDDVVDIIEEMPANVVKRILASADAETRAAVNEILHYPPDSAGSIMTTEYISLSADMTVEDAFTRIRRVGVDKETIYTCYVTAPDRRLIGLVTVKTLLLSDKATAVGDIMERNVISVRTDADRELVAQELGRYDFLAMPVTDAENRLVGIVTFDDAIDVIREEATEDIEKMAAITPTDKPYLKTGVFQTFGKRIPWLCLLMISATFTGVDHRAFRGCAGEGGDPHGVHPDADGHGRQRGQPGVGDGHPRAVAGRTFDARHFPHPLEGTARGAAVRRGAGRARVREAIAVRPGEAFVWRWSSA